MGGFAFIFSLDMGTRIKVIDMGETRIKVIDMGETRIRVIDMGETRIRVSRGDADEGYGPGQG